MATSINQLISSVVEHLGEKTVTCDKHGNYVSTGRRFTTGRRMKIWTSCPGCKEDERAEGDRKDAEAKAARQREYLERLLNQTAIPQLFLDRDFDNWRVTNDGQLHAVKVAMEYVKSFDSYHATGSSLVFSGAKGTGKSHLAAAILKGILPRHVGVYMTFMGMIRLIRETWRADSKRTESQVIAELGTLPLLVLDEIGVQYGTEAEHTLLFEVMDRRYRDQKPSILLTNQDKDGFKRFVGDRVYDRMTETARWVTFDWASYRTQARKDHGK